MRVVPYLQSLTSTLRRPFRDREGQGLIEYALLGGLVVLVSIGALASVGTWTPVAAGF